MKNNPRKNPADRKGSAANDAGSRAEKLAELRRRFSKASEKTLGIIADVTHPEIDPAAPLGADDRPVIDGRGAILGQMARREARHELLKLIAKEFPAAKWDGLFTIATSRCPELFAQSK